MTNVIPSGRGHRRLEHGSHSVKHELTLSGSVSHPRPAWGLAYSSPLSSPRSPTRPTCPSSLPDVMSRSKSREAQSSRDRSSLLDWLISATEVKPIRVFLLVVTLGAAAAPFAAPLRPPPVLRHHLGLQYDVQLLLRYVLLSARGHPNVVRLPLLHLLPFAADLHLLLQPRVPGLLGPLRDRLEGRQALLYFGRQGPQERPEGHPREGLPPSRARCPPSPAQDSVAMEPPPENVPKDKK